MVRRMKGSGGSAWPTENWKTPSSQEPGVENRPLINADGTPWTGGERAYDAETGRLVQTGLPQMVKAWPSPQARDYRSGDNPDSPRQARKTEQGWSQNLNDVAEMGAMWFTPDVPNGGRALPKGTTLTGKRADGSKAQVGLNNQVSMWTTPQAHDVTQRGSGQVPTAKAGNACLARDATTWPTPASRDHKGENSPDHLSNGTGRLHLDQLPNAVAFLYSRPDLEPAPNGLQRSDPRLTWRRLRRLVISSHGRAVWKRMAASGGKRRLNPNFVNWLMGWPPGHSLCVSLEMEWSLWSQRMRGRLSALPTASGAWIWKPPAEASQPKQMNLFGE